MCNKYHYIIITIYNYYSGNFHFISNNITPIINGKAASCKDAGEFEYAN